LFSIFLIISHNSALRPAGWFLGIAVDDPLDGLAWALAASDRPS